MLQLEHMVIRQGNWLLAADWSLPVGAKVAVIGPSGAGKSTLLQAIAGFVAPTQGRILWQGRDQADVLPGQRPVSILFQDQNLFPHLTISRNLGLGLNPRLSLGADDWIQVDRVLDRVGLAGMGGRRPAELSGGQQARVALARALLRARPLLLLDEPFSALGPALKADMMTLVIDVLDETGATLVMVTHDPEEARRYADQTIFVADGIAMAPQPTADIFADPPPDLRSYLGG